MEGKVKCEICGKYYVTLDKHLTTHNINKRQYVEMYPDSPTESKEYSAKRSAILTARNKTDKMRQVTIDRNKSDEMRQVIAERNKDPEFRKLISEGLRTSEKARLHQKKFQEAGTRSWKESRLEDPSKLREDIDSWRGDRFKTHSYNGVEFRSKHEKKFAQLLDEGGIEYEYESRVYDLGGNSLYLPDFIVRYKGIEYVVEIKSRPSEVVGSKLHLLEEENKLAVCYMDIKNYTDFQTIITHCHV